MKQKSINVDEALKALESIVNSHSKSESITPEIALTSILEFYRNYQATIESETEDNDMLLFQYGAYDWNGKGRKFEFNLTRQLLDNRDDEFHQIGLTLYFKPEEMGEVEAFNLWSIDQPSIEKWKEVVSTSEGFEKATNASLIEYKIHHLKT